MYFEQIISLLSNHRIQGDCLEVPTTLSKSQIISLIGASLSPNVSQDNISTKIIEDLRELEAKGEINGGSRNRYCIAPPTVLAASENNLTGLLFQGDRAYLTLVHQVLDTEQNCFETKIKTNINNFQAIKNKLSQVGVSFLAIDHSIESLPLPELPKKVVLRLPYILNPFDNSVLQYYPQNNFHDQVERWQEVRKHQLTNKSLLQLITKEYLWFEDNKFYELERDNAVLAMFAIDEKTQHPLQIPWDRSSGKLHLKGVSLPSAYAKWLWSLSEPIDNNYRTRYIKPNNQYLVESAFKHLGCLLV